MKGFVVSQLQKIAPTKHSLDFVKVWKRHSHYIRIKVMGNFYLCRIITSKLHSLQALETRCAISMIVCPNQFTAEQGVSLISKCDLKEYVTPSN